jgi:hypothetical protein
LPTDPQRRLNLFCCGSRQNRFRLNIIMPPVCWRASASFLFPVLLCASSLPQLSVEELVSQSDTIVAGRIVRAWAAMDSENRFIWTHYEIKVGATLKGQAQDSVVVAEPGGTLNGVSLLVPSATHYTVGEEISVFLYRTPIGYLRTTNYGQGKFVIAPDHRLHARQPAAGTSVATLDGATWSDFQSRVARIVAAQKGARR